MRRKARDILRDQQGLAMILVLCLGALFVALAAALVYAASLMMANADRQLPEQDVYELAVSFSDVLEQELLHYTGAKEKDGAMTEENDQSIGYFINHIYVKKGSIDNPYGDDTDHTFTLQAPEGIDEMTVALEAAQSVCALPVLCSMTVQADGSGYFGGTCVEAVETLQELGAAAVGINCSTGPDQLESLVRNMRQAAKVPLLVKPNAGMPEISPEGEAIYSMGPEAFAQHMRTLIDAGAALVGGCCGTNPRYISALRDVLPR